MKPYLAPDLIPTLTKLTAAVVPGATRADVRVDGESCTGAPPPPAVLEPLPLTCRLYTQMPPLHQNVAVSLAKFVGSIVTMRSMMGEVLDLQPDATGNIKEADARRVVDADAGLRALLAAGSLPEADFERAFGSSKALPRALTDREFVFYDLETRCVEFDSDFSRRVVTAVLESHIHKSNLKQARARLA